MELIKRGDELKGSKLGRPVMGLPKTNDLKVRLDDEVHNKVIEYATKYKITKAEVVRLAIQDFFKKK